MKGGARQCQPIWDEFFNNREELLYESEKILARPRGEDLDAIGDLEIDETLSGVDRKRLIKQRVNQGVFRRIVLANYDNRCALSDIDIPDFLVASHILPWAANTAERLNPTNGICLSSFYDKAFDKGFLTFDDEFKAVFSPRLKKSAEKEYFARFFLPYEGRRLNLPRKYPPNVEFLKWHRENIFVVEMGATH